ncbi:signal peptide peptidase SppA, 36K type [Neorickettsia risticii str. Illinois]|uniref:Signal peptide peptidase SppA, 36K type n=1 Tax=Neorickettsia risticii (strain Illinois) TaxID=434131 RepID=C6V4Q6_NEORI|nr:signal peptide peptidase SppA [Neorickettsia risticii]ACT69327.1 signal peptide peptidase SppA, 36K type [Neorickettsia risticii str. Illinois]
MNFLGDAFIENSSLRKRLTFWKVVTFIVIGVLLVVSGSSFRGGLFDSFSAPYIGRVVFSGIIDQDLVRNSQFASFADNPKIKAVILHVDSGGGGAAASEALYNAVRSVSLVKPVVVVANGMMASGAYMVAMAAEHIVAYNSSIVGSIGMILQAPNFHEIGKKVGIKMDVVRSGRLKAFPSILEEFTKEARSSMEHSISVANEHFLSMVQERRKITDARVMSEIATGKIFTGKEALEFALVDEIGDETNAVRWLKEMGITGKIRDLGFVSGRGFRVDKISPSSYLSVLNEFFRYLYSPGLLAVFPGTST